MAINYRKAAIVGCGFVGSSIAFRFLQQGLFSRLVLLDANRDRAEGEAMDLSDGLPYGASMEITAGTYDDIADCGLVVITAGVNQKPGESRLELLQRNTQVFGSIIEPVVHSGFSGIFLVATNPVDIMTRVAYELSGFNSNRVFGTGTTLDTARLRYLLGEYFSVDPRNMHAYVIGEHGDSEFVPWSQAMLATKSVVDICEHSGGKFCVPPPQRISTQVRDAAQKIIEAKKATYYGIGMAMSRIVRAVFSGENSVLTVSARLRGEYGQKDVYAGVPCLVNRNGVDRLLELNLTEEERKLFADSCNILQENYEGISL